MTPPENKESKIKRITLQEQGPKLPLGIITPDNQYSKDISTRRWRMKEERAIGELKSQNQDVNVAQYVGMILTVMLQRLGYLDFDKLKEVEKRAHISQMYMGDVFYAYVWLRVAAMGPQLDMDVICPRCKHKFPVKGDLNTIEVDVCDDISDAVWNYKLKEPFEIRGKQVTELQMSPPRWTALENMSNIGENIGAAKSGIILGSISGIANWKEPDGTPTKVVLAESELDEMGKRDIEEITSLVDDYALGPNMALEGNCPKCQSPYKTSIDWSYDNFFGSSSPSER